MRAKNLMGVGMSVLLTSTACNQPLTTTDMQHAAMDESKYAPRSYFKNMADNAMLQDMSVADIHFVPHSQEISGTGAARLDRMSHLLDVYGGTVHYETREMDEGLVTKRLANVREYLAMTGCNMDRVKIEAGASGGRTTPASRAIKAYDKETTPAAKAPAAPAQGSTGQTVGQTSGMGSGK